MNTNNISINDRITLAMNNTVITVPGYLERTLQQRLPDRGRLPNEGPAGSIVDLFTTVSDLRYAIEHAEWKFFDHPSIMEGCTAFVTHDITGHIGVVDLKSLNLNTVITLDDRKNTGKVSCTVKGQLGPHTDHSVIILGLEKGVEVVYTFHPGDPVSPSRVDMEPGMHGKEVTVVEALDMGLTTAKIV